MGVEYSLCHEPTKTRIDLGKLHVDGYQMPAARIAAWLRAVGCGTILLCDDTGAFPRPDGPEWIEVDAYYSPTGPTYDDVELSQRRNGFFDGSPIQQGD